MLLRVPEERFVDGSKTRKRAGGCLKMKKKTTPVGETLEEELRHGQLVVLRTTDKVMMQRSK